MKFHTIIPLILTLSLLGCQTPPADITPPAPTAEHTLIPTAAPTQTPTPTEVPLEALPVEVLVQKYLAGEIDNVSFLAVEKRQLFSVALAEEKNKRRGVNPIIYNNEAYIDPATGKMKSTEDGSTQEQQTIEMYVPIFTDEEGYVHVMDETGKWIKIENSKGVNFQIFETLEEVRAEITMPTTEKIGPEFGERAGLTIPEGIIVGLPGESGAMMPVILRSKDLGEIYLSGGGKIPTQEMLVAENAYAARKIKVSAPNLGLYKEGGDFELRSSGFLQTHYDVFEAMEENVVYYLIFYKDQKQNFSSTYPALGGKEVTRDYNGLTPSDLIFDVLSRKIKSKDFIWLDGRVLIQADK